MDQNKFAYYDTLAEYAFLHGLADERLRLVGSYRPGMSIRDIDRSVQESRQEAIGNGKINYEGMAEKLASVFDIDTSQTFDDFEKRLREGEKKKE